MTDPTIIVQPVNPLVTVSSNYVANPAGSTTLGAIELAGDLSGIAAAPTVAKINGVAVSGTAASPRTLVATSAANAAWTLPPGLYPATGIISGAVMTANTATSFKVSAGTGVIVDFATTPTNPTATLVTIPAQTVTFGAPEMSRPVSWWLSDGNGNITSQAARPQHAQRRTAIQLGVTTFVSGAIAAITPAVTYLPQSTVQFVDALYELGPFNVTGSTNNVVTANGANLSFNKSSGQSFNPGAGYANGPNEIHYTSNPAETPVSFLYGTQISGSETVSTVLNPTLFDNAGTLTSVGGGINSSTVQAVFLIPTGVAGTQVVVQYGQVVYSTLAAAVAAAGNGTVTLNPDLDGTSFLLAWICFTRGCASLLDSTTCSIIRAPRFAYP